MFNFVRLSDGGIHRLDNVRSEVNVLTHFAQHLFHFRQGSEEKENREKLKGYAEKISKAGEAADKARAAAKKAEEKKDGEDELAPPIKTENLINDILTLEEENCESCTI